MFNIKVAVSVLGATLAILCTSATTLEAGHHHRHHHRSTHVNIHAGPVIAAPTYVVRSPAYVYEPVPVYEPVCVPPQPVVAYPVYQPVYVAPQPSLFTSFSFGWFFR